MSLFDLLAGAGSAAAGYALSEDIRKTGAQGAQQMQQLGQQLQDQTAFRGYGVQTGLGRSTIDPTGSLNVGVGPQQSMLQAGQSMFGGAQGLYGQAATAAQQAANPYQQQAMAALSGAANPFMQQAAGGIGAAQGMLMDASGNPLFSDAASAIQGGLSNQNFAAANRLMQQGAMNQAYGGAMGAQQGAMGGLGGQQAAGLGASQQAMQQALADRAGREQQVFERAMALQEPGLQRAQAAQQAREFAMGRGGVRGSQFGGTAEDAAMARARAEAANQAAFQAMGQVEQEAANRAAMASQFGQLGTQAAGLQSNIGTAMGQLGAQQAQLAQEAGRGLGTLGTQQAQLAQSGGQALGALGTQQAQLGQSAASTYGNLANQLGAMGSQQFANQLAQGQAMGALGGQAAELGMQQAGMLSNIAQAQGQAGLQGYNAAFTPMQQQLNALQVGQQAANMAQTGQLTGAGYGAQLGLGGIQAQINAEKAASELFGNLFGAGMSAIGSIGSGGNIPEDASLLDMLLGKIG